MPPNKRDNSKIRAILFDKDGTLLDFSATWSGFARELALEAAEGNETVAQKLLLQVGYDPLTETFLAGSVMAAGTNAQVVALLYPHLNNEHLRLRIADADQRTARIARERAIPLPGILGTLSELHRAGYRLGLATNDATAGAEQTLLNFGVAHLFDAAYGYDAVANPKPAPDVLLAFADTIGLAPGEIAMVGDNRHDLETARNGGAGLAIGVLSGTGNYSDLAPLADVVLDSIVDLPALLYEAR